MRLVSGWLTGVTVAILEWKKWGTAGPRKKVGCQHKCLSCMVIFHCNEGWFAMIKPIKPNIGLWISSEPSPKTSNRLNFFWLKVICCICQSNELEREIEQKTGGASRRLAKNLGGPWPTQPPLRTATVALSLLCDVRYSIMEKLSWEFLIYCYIT